LIEGKIVGAVLLMAGDGRRFKSDLPKQFHLLAGKPVYLFALEKLLSLKIIDEIIVVSHPSWCELDLGKIKVAPGGATRQQSSFIGLKAFEVRPDIVLIHDGARPFVSEKIIIENINSALISGAVDTCISATDTVVFAPNRKEISAIPNRAHYLRGQTPQTFLYDLILEAHERAIKDGVENVTDDCSLVLRLGKGVYIVDGEEKNFKITSQLDLALAEQLTKTSLN